MTPSQIAALQTVAFILDKIGTWPVSTLCAVVVIGPWFAMAYIAWGQSRRFEAVTKMYENNVALVKSYEKMAADQQDLIILNTRQMEGVNNRVDSNLFCPILKERSRKTEVGG